MALSDAEVLVHSSMPERLHIERTRLASYRGGGGAVRASSAPRVESRTSVTSGSVHTHTCRRGVSLPN